MPYEDDEVTRLIIDTPRRRRLRAGVAPDRRRLPRLAAVRRTTDSAALAALAPGLTPEMVAAVSKLMRNQDLMLGGQPGAGWSRASATRSACPATLAVRLQPNHPTDSPAGIAASVLDGLLYGGGDAVIGINPATDSVPALVQLLQLLDELIAAPRRSRRRACVLTHVTNTLQAIERGAPVDLVFQSHRRHRGAPTAASASTWRCCDEAHAAALALRRGHGRRQRDVFRDRPGQRAVGQRPPRRRPADAARRAPTRWRARYRPLLVNTVVGFIGPEYLYDGKQIIRAGLEDHFCGKLLGLPMGCDICYTNHAEADQDDMDNLLVLLAAAGLNFIMGVPGADDVMLNYQSTSFHDALFVRQLLGLKRAPEFEAWLQRHGHHRRAAAGLLPAPAASRRWLRRSARC